ncbi:MAG TPA: peroxiredoxin, partial [Candidatus Megaira endosymbiont of Hartmannula sinica]|nr:peroxiredoxin [Candidatus Megaera endosymbiont of Hartmannula sinica]
FLVIFFYPKDNTPGCTSEAKQFNDLFAEFKNMNTNIVGVSKDTIISHNKFREKLDLKFHLVSDQEGRLCDAYNVWKEKSMFGKTFLGIERSSFLVDKNLNIIHLWRKVSVSNHAKDVLNTINKIKK